MRISNQLIVTLIVLIGLGVATQATAKTRRANAKSKHMYRLSACDCVGLQNNIPTFLSDLVGEPHIEVEGRSIAKAQKKVDRICYKDFKRLTKVKRSEVSGSGCKKYRRKVGRSRWKAI